MGIFTAYSWVPLAILFMSLREVKVKNSILCWGRVDRLKWHSERDCRDSSRLSTLRSSDAISSSSASFFAPEIGACGVLGVKGLWLASVVAGLWCDAKRQCDRSSEMERERERDRERERERLKCVCVCVCVCVCTWKDQQLVVWIWRNDWYVVVTQERNTTAAAPCVACMFACVCILVFFVASLGPFLY